MYGHQMFDWIDPLPLLDVKDHVEIADSKNDIVERGGAPTRLM